MLTEKWTNHSGLELNYAIGPDNGSPIIMLHGVTRRWQSFLPLLASFSTHRQIYAVDFRGHGLSPRNETGYAVIDYVSDIIKFIEQFDEPVTLYGHSLGAMVSAAVASAIPEKISSIILEDPPLNVMGEEITQSILHSFFSGIQKYVGDQRDIQIIADELSKMKMIDPITNQKLLFGEIRDAIALRFTASSLQNLDPSVLKPIIDGHWTSGYGAESIYRKIQCPVLLLQGDTVAGGMLTDEEVLQMKEWSSNITHIKFPNTGHIIHWAETQNFTNFVLGFLEST